MGLLAWRTFQRTWRSHVVLAVVTAASVAVVMAVLIGAGRAESAQDRLRARTLAADLQVDAGDRSPREALRAVAGVDGVTAAGTIRELFVRPAGSDHFPDYDLLALAPGAMSGAAVDQPFIVDGRAPRPDAVDEVALNEDLAAELHAGLGATVALESMSDEWVDAAFNGGDPGPPDGPVVSARVVGIARTPADFGRWVGVIHLSDAFADRFADEIRTYTLVEARLTPQALERATAARAFDVPGLEDAEVQPSYFAGSTATQDGLRSIATALRLIGVAAVVAGLTAAGLTLLRLAREAMADRALLAAIGFTRAELVRTVTVVLAPSVVGGVALGAVVGVLASPQVSLGLAWAVDPTGDDIVVVWPTVAAVAGTALGLGALLLGVGAAWTGRSAVRPSTSGWALPSLRRPLAGTLGLRRAMFGSIDRGGRVSRTATVAAAAGVAVSVGALLVGASIQRLQDDPSLSGQGPAAQRVIDAGEDPSGVDRALAVLEADDRIADLVGLHVAFDVRAEGVEGVDGLTALVYDIRRGGLGAVTTSGRTPVQPDEVAIGPSDLEAMGLTVGDEIDLSTDAGSAHFRIVGAALFPEGDFAHDSGVALSLSGAGFLGGVEGTALHQVAYTWAPGVDPASADQSLVDAGLRPFTSADGLVPAVVSNLGEVRSLPGVLAGLVLVLALVTTLHAVSLTTRQRRDEAGTLRALGMTPRSVAAMVEVHALTMAVVALCVGAPLGVAAGRVVWTAIVERANVIDRPAVGGTALAAVAAAMAVGSLLLSLPVAVGAMRRRPAAALRTE